jgi:hypothetical protein
MARSTLLLPCIALVACATASQGSFTPRRFESARDPYAVYLSDAHELVGKDWRIANYEVDYQLARTSGGLHRKAEQTIFTNKAKLRPRHGRGYDVKRAYDLDGDGRADVRSEEPRDDLAFEHRGSPGRIWLRTVPVRPAEGAADLRDLAVRLGADGHDGRTLATQSCELAGREAVWVDLDGVAVRTRLVAVRTGFTRELGGRQLPVVMIAGFSADADDFDALARDFDDFLGRIALGSRTGGIPKAGSTDCQPRRLL